MLHTLFLPLQLSNFVELLLVLSFSTRKQASMASGDIVANSLKNNELKTTHNTSRGCRVHFKFFRQPFSKELYTNEERSYASEDSEPSNTNVEDNACCFILQGAYFKHICGGLICEGGPI